MKTYRGAGIAFFRQKDGQYEAALHMLAEQG